MLEVVNDRYSKSVAIGYNTVVLFDELFGVVSILKLEINGHGRGIDGV